MKTKKIILSLFVIATFTAYALYKNFGDSNEKVPVTPPKPVSITPPAAATAQYKDGTYTGSNADAYFGNLQIQATISGGKISDVVFLDYPHDQGTSRRINTEAIPYLKQEAIAAQSASVDIVSGATQSSQAFEVSLASALALAKK